ncbi:hypothetical protein RAS1_07530 [Phycisphaerae bacterium RAS1]|nr:hypothetical protein RAS1_07530 [Phycisphaerae bacterium RAS1]
MHVGPQTRSHARPLARGIVGAVVAASVALFGGCPLQDAQTDNPVAVPTNSGGGGTQPGTTQMPGSSVADNTSPAANVVVLPESGAGSLAVQRPSELVINPGAPLPNVGDIIVSTVNGGALRQVDSVTVETDGSVTLATSPATIAQAVENGEFSFKEPEGAAKTRARARLYDVFALDENLDHELYNSDGVIASMAGSFAMDLGVNIEMEVREYRLVMFASSIEGNASIELSGDLVASLSGHAEREFPLLARPLRRYLYGQIGPYPVVIEVSANLIAGFSIDASASEQIRVGVSTESLIHCGARYERGADPEWSPIAEQNFDLATSGPTLCVDGTLDSRFFVRPVVELQLYSVLGPSFDLEPYVSVIASGTACVSPGQSPSGTYSWEAVAGIAGHAKVKADILDRWVLESPRLRVFDVNRTWSGSGVTPPPNQRPVAENQSVSVGFETTTPIVLSASDPDNLPQALTYSIGVQPNHGALSGSPPLMSYLPNPGFSGSDSFTFDAYDGNLRSNTATVTITVQERPHENQPAVATDQTVSVPFETATNVTLTASDPDNGPQRLTYAVIGQPSHGILTGTPPSVTYVPNSGYSGTDAFTFRAFDGLAYSAIATVSITVQPQGAQIGNLSVTVQNQDGGATSGASVVRYNQNWQYIDERTANGSGVASWSGITVDSYNLEVYYNGEYWVNDVNVPVTLNQTTNRTLRRNEPYSYEFRVIRTDTNQNVTGGSVPQGTPLRLELLVRNSSPVVREARIRNLRLDRDRASSWDFETTTASQTITSGGGTRTFNVTNFSPSSTGTYYRSFETQTLVNGNWIKTDAWAWDPAVIITPNTGNLCVTVLNANGSNVAGAGVLRYTTNWQLIDQLTTNSAGTACWNGIAVGSYNLEVYYNGEYWVNDVNVPVTLNQTTNRTLRRNEPYSYDFRVIRTDTNQNVTGQSVPQGTPLRVETYVRNESPVSRDARLNNLRLDRDRTSSWDFETTTASQTISSGGGTRIFSVTNFAPSATGTYYRSFETQTFVNSNWVKTDSWGWDPAVTITPNTGNLSVTVQNQDGSATSGASVVRYNQNWQYIDERTTNSSGVASWSGIPVGSYNLEVYYNGEYWVNDVNVPVVLNQTTNRTLRRNEPYSYEFRVIRTDTNQNVTGGSVPQGTPLRLEVLVRNGSPVAREARIRNLRLDRDRAGSWDFETTTASQTISSGGGTRTFNVTNFSPSATGPYYRSFETQTLVNGNWVKTDSWSWDPAVTLTSNTGNLNITVQNVNGNSVSGATVVRYSQSWQPLDERTTNGSGVASWSGIPVGSYNLEVYYNGEYWVNDVNVPVTLNQTTNRTLRRNEPYSFEFRVIRTDTNQNVTGGSVPRNTPLRIEVYVRNDSPVARSVRIANLRIDRSRSSPYDFESTTGSQSVSAGGGTRVYSTTVPTSVTGTAGTYYRVFETQTSVNGTWVRTDSWPSWSVAVTVN